MRYHERAGLLAAPAHSGDNFRVTGTHVEKLSLIRHCRLLDKTYKEIRTLLR
ncbi:MerR family transcriptional regulator [Azotobacter vinelandii]|uniref:MerR family transcriptional regulator n=1 Tax=Azotobacter vinelandii TaxID=354 RepID=UPI0039F600C3